MTAIPPDHLVDLESGIWDVLEDSTAETLVALRDYPAENAWENVAAWWPELLLAILLLALAWRGWRVARQPGVAGRPCCRRCGYPVGDAVGGRCVECGSSLGERNVVQGRRRASRLVFLVALVALLVVGWLVGRDQLPRRGSFSAWLHWPVESSAGRFTRYAREAVRIDVASGAVLERVQLGWRPAFAVPGAAGSTWRYDAGIGRLTLVDIRTGDVVTSFAMEIDGPSQAHHHAELDLLFVYHADRALETIDLATGERRTVWRPADRPAQWSLTPHALVHVTGTRRFLLTGVESAEGLPRVILWDHDRQAAAEVGGLEPVEVFGAAGGYVWQQGPGSNLVAVFELDEECRRRHLPLPPSCRTVRLDGSGRFMFAGGSGVIAVIDLVADTLVATLAAPDRASERITLSRDGRTLIRQGGGVVSVWDVGPVLAAPDPDGRGG